MKPSLLSLLAVASLSAAVSTPAQTVTTIVTGTATSTRTGQDVANAGDIDGDGIDDIIVGIEEDSTGPRNFQFTGRATVYSGASIGTQPTPTVIWTWTGNFIGDRFGCAVDGAGDVDGDGVPDLVVGARGVDKLVGPPYYGDAGSVYVFSGATGAELFKIDAWQFTSPSFVVDGARFGYSVAGAGDVDADGYADIIVGGYVGSRAGFGGEGAAVVLSGKTYQTPSTPQVIWSFHGGATQYFLGFSVDGAGDVNRDGFDDLIVGVVDAADNNGNGAFAGEARIYDGQTGAVLDSIQGGAAGEFLGGSVAGVGDVDQDGYDDVAVGIVFSGGTGEARVYSGAQLGVMPRGPSFQLRSFPGGAVNDLFGFDVNGGGDMDADGVPDIIVGSILETGALPVTGVVDVYSGATGALIQTFNGPQTGGGYGFSVALGGDHDGDGFDEAIVGSPFFQDGGVMQAGHAEMLDADLDQANPGRTPPKSRQIGPGCIATRAGSGQTVLPTLQLRGRAGLGEMFSMRLRAATLGQPWILNIGAGVDIDLSPFGLTGCTLYATGNGFVFTPVPAITSPVDGSGEFAPGIAIPNDPALVGQPLYFQANILAPGSNPAGVVVSNGLELTFGN